MQEIKNVFKLLKLKEMDTVIVPKDYQQKPVEINNGLICLAKDILDDTNYLESVIIRLLRVEWQKEQGYKFLSNDLSLMDAVCFLVGYIYFFKNQCITDFPFEMAIKYAKYLEDQICLFGFSSARQSWINDSKGLLSFNNNIEY